MASSSVLLFVCILLAATCASQAAKFHSPNVLELGNKEFNTSIADGRLYFVKLYAPWCGHCKKLAPTWSNLAEAYKEDTDVVIAHIDCTKEKDLCNSMSIRGYPTLLMFYNGEQYSTSRGPRDLESLKAYVDKTKQELFSENTA